MSPQPFGTVHGLTPDQWQKLLQFISQLLPIIGGIIGKGGGQGLQLRPMLHHELSQSPHINLTPTQLQQLISIVEQALPLLGSILGVTVGQPNQGSGTVDVTTDVG